MNILTDNAEFAQFICNTFNNEVPDTLFEHD